MLGLRGGGRIQERGRQNTGEGDSDRPLMYTVLLEVVVVVVV